MSTHVRSSNTFTGDVVVHEIKGMDRGLTWGHDETCSLIRIWSDPSIQEQLETSRRNSWTYEQIAKNLKGFGFERTGEQCRNKIKQLKCCYNEVKKENGQPGKGRKHFAYFRDMDLVLGNCPVTMVTIPPVLFDPIIKDEKEGS